MKNFKTYQEVRENISTGQVTCVQLVQYYLDRIKEHESLNAFLEVYSDEALSHAKEADKRFSEGHPRPLEGLVVGLKDVLVHKDHHSYASSKILETYKSPFTGTGVQRLIEAGAIIIGRQNCDEFAMGSSNENSAFGPAKNGIDETRVPGGSSGGSAVAVQMDLCQVSLGTDTGGSVRQPASFCGVVGLKPSYSRVSRYGLIAYASSFDCLGVLSKSVEDSALILEFIAGEDEMDATSSKRPVPNYSRDKISDQKRKIGYLKAPLEMEGLQPEVKVNFEALIEDLKAQGHTLVELDNPFLEHALPVYYILTTAEASTNLARFDGVRYGHRTSNAEDLNSMYELTRTEGFGEEVKRRIMLGTFVLSAQYHDAYFTKAQRVRKKIQSFIKNQFSDVDFILNPTTPTSAFEIGANKENFMELYLADIFTVQASVGGFPAISIPMGVDKKGLPLGIQIMANSFEEQELLNFSRLIEEREVFV